MRYRHILLHDTIRRCNTRGSCASQDALYVLVNETDRHEIKWIVSSEVPLSVQFIVSRWTSVSKGILLLVSLRSVDSKPQSLHALTKVDGEKGGSTVHSVLCYVVLIVVIPYKSQVFMDMGQTSAWVTINEIHGRMQILYSNALNVSRSCILSRYVFRIVLIWRDISLSIRPSWKVNALWSWYVCRVRFRHVFFLFEVRSLTFSFDKAKHVHLEKFQSSLDFARRQRCADDTIVETDDVEMCSPIDYDRWRRVCFTFIFALSDVVAISAVV